MPSLPAQGGVSGGLFESLNCGFGSGDAAETVARNRAIAMERLGFSADRLVTCYQVHSTTVVTVEKPWPREAAPRADGMVTRGSGIALGVLDRRLCPGPVRGSGRQGHRCGAWRLARRARRHRRSHDRADGGARRRAGPHPRRRSALASPGPPTRSGRNFRSHFSRRTRPARLISRRRCAPAISCSICRAISSTGWLGPGSRPSSAPLTTRSPRSSAFFQLSACLSAWRARSMGAGSRRSCFSDRLHRSRQSVSPAVSASSDLVCRFIRSAGHLRAALMIGSVSWSRSAAALSC